MDIDKNFSHITSALKEEFNGVEFREEEVRQCISSREDLVELVCRKTGLPKEEAEQKIQHILNRFGMDSEAARSFMAKVTNKVEGTMENLKNRF